MAEGGEPLLVERVAVDGGQAFVALAAPADRDGDAPRTFTVRTAPPPGNEEPDALVVNGDAWPERADENRFLHLAALLPEGSTLLEVVVREADAAPAGADLVALLAAGQGSLVIDVEDDDEEGVVAGFEIELGDEALVVAATYRPAPGPSRGVLEITLAPEAAATGG